MNNIITTQKLETVTSIEAANMIGKEHKQLLKDIRRYINQLHTLIQKTRKDHVLM